MFAELLRHPGVTEELELRSEVGFLAFHGGSLERGTAELAAAAADAAGASIYSVRQPEDLRWHVPSRLVDPASSDALTAFVDHVDVAISIHGYGRVDFWTSLLIGGSHRQLARQASRTLRDALPGYEIVDDLDAIPVELRGLHPANPVNRVRSGGIQIELPPRVRNVAGRERDHAALVGALVSLA